MTDQLIERGLRLADMYAADTLEFELQPTIDADRYLAGASDLQISQVVSCIEHLKWRGLVTTEQTPDGLLVTFLDDSA